MDIFYALADQRRRRIVELLAGSGEMSATQIYKKFNVTAQAISQHLGILLAAGLVSMEKRAQQHIYRLNPSSMTELGEWARQTERQWTERFDVLEKVVKDEKKKMVDNKTRL